MFELDQLHPNVRGLKPSATLRINETSNRLIREGREVIKLGLGQSPFPVPERVVETLQQHAREKDYLPVRGLEPLRTTIAEYYKLRESLDVTAENVLIGPGSKELLFNLQMACDGDLIIPAPSWVSYAPQAELLGRKVNYIQTQPENNWQIDPEDLESACSGLNGRTAILILNYPSNPTGCSYDPEAMKALATVCRKHQLIVVADEIYAETTFSGAFTSMVQYYPEGTVISSGLSKWCGAGGWRLGTMIFPAGLSTLQDAMAVIASETYTSINAPAQYAACVAFTPSKAIDSYLQASRKVLATIADVMVTSLGNSGLDMVRPAGGFYLFISFEKFRGQLVGQGIVTDEELCNRLIADTGVAVLPGSDFGMSSDQLYTRLAFVDFDGLKALNTIDTGVSKEVFMTLCCPKLVEACSRLDRWLKHL